MKRKQVAAFTFGRSYKLGQDWLKPCGCAEAYVDIAMTSNDYCTAVRRTSHTILEHAKRIQHITTYPAGEETEHVF